jgi:hypothetical protein
MQIALKKIILLKKTFDLMINIKYSWGMYGMHIDSGKP